MEARLTAEKLLKGHNSGKNQLSMTSIIYTHLQVMVTITGKFHQNPLKTVRGVVDTRLCLRKDGQTDESITIVPFDLRRETISSSEVFPTDLTCYRNDRSSGKGGGVFLFVYNQYDSYEELVNRLGGLSLPSKVWLG